MTYSRPIFKSEYSMINHT